MTRLNPIVNKNHDNYKAMKWACTGHVDTIFFQKGGHGHDMDTLGARIL